MEKFGGEKTNEEMKEYRWCGALTDPYYIAGDICERGKIQHE